MHSLFQSGMSFQYAFQTKHRIKPLKKTLQELEKLTAEESQLKQEQESGIKINPPNSAAAPEREPSNHRAMHYARPAASFHLHVLREVGEAPARLPFSPPPSKPDRGDGGGWVSVRAERQSEEWKRKQSRVGRAQAQKRLWELEVEELRKRWHNFTLVNGGSSLSRRWYTFFIVVVFLCNKKSKVGNDLANCYRQKISSSHWGLGD